MPPLSIETFAPAVDHTLLDPAATAARIDALCDEALEYGFAAVCVYPWWVARAAARLPHGPVVCTVAGFPHGLDTTEAKVAAARRSLADGAREVDVVMAWGALADGFVAAAGRDIADVVQAVHTESPSAMVKVIVESAQLTDAQLSQACRLVAESGADFAKTSTGVAGPATVAAVARMRGLLPPEVAVKASAGIRSPGDAAAMLEAGAMRLGTSSALAIMADLAADAVA
jgi:deoxyribose-phosphate aldolase